MAESEKLAEAGAPTTEVAEVDLSEYMEHLTKDFRVADDDGARLRGLVRTLALAAQKQSGATTVPGNAVKAI